MHFSWLGSTCVKIQTKHEEKDVVIVIDAYRPKQGAFPRSLTPDIALYTRGENDSITLSGEPFVMSSPGECETHSVLITAVEGNEPGEVMYRLDAEGMSVGHLGVVGKPINNKQLEVLGGVDILFVGCDGKKDDMEQKIKMVNEIEPRVVMPIDYQSDNDPDAPPVDTFLKEMGSINIKPEPKIIIKKKDLPEEETKVFILSKE